MFLEEMQAYFWAERQGAVIGVMFGAAVLLACLFLRNQLRANRSLKGLYYVLIFIGIFGLASAFNVYNNTARIETFTDIYEDDPLSLVNIEMARMDAVNSRWFPLKITWLLLVLIGIVWILLKRRSVWTGFAIGLILIGSVAFTVDLFAKYNADHYMESLSREKLRLE